MMRLTWGLWRGCGSVGYWGAAAPPQRKGDRLVAAESTTAESAATAKTNQRTEGPTTADEAAAEFSLNFLAPKAALSWLDWERLRFSGQPSRLGRPTKKRDQRQLLLQNRFSAPPKTPPLRSSSSSSAHLFLSTCNKVFTGFRCCRHLAPLLVLLAPKVILDYLRPLITNPIPSHPHIAVKTTSPLKI